MHCENLARSLKLNLQQLRTLKIKELGTDDITQHMKGWQLTLNNNNLATWSLLGKMPFQSGEGSSGMASEFEYIYIYNIYITVKTNSNRLF